MKIFALLFCFGAFFNSGNALGTEVDAMCIEASPKDSIIHVELSKDSAFFLARKNGMYGLVTVNDSIILPFEYQKITALYGRSCDLRIDEELRVMTNNKFGAISVNSDLSINVVIHVKYDVLNRGGNCYNNPRWRFGIQPRIAKRDGKYGFIGGDFKEICPFVYDEVEEFVGQHAVVIQNGKLGSINNQGKLVIPCNYDQVQAYTWTDAVVTANGKVGVFSDSGVMLVPLIYDQIEQMGYGLKSFRLGDKWGVMNTDTKIEIEAIWDTLLGFEYDYLEVVRDGKFGLYKKVVRTTEDSITGETNSWTTSFIEYPIVSDSLLSGHQIAHTGFGHVIKNGKYGLVNSLGDVTCPPLYDKMELGQYRSKDSNIPITKDGKQGLLNSLGSPFIEPIYDLLYARNYSNQDPMYQVYLGAKTGMLSQENELIIPIEYDSIKYPEVYVLNVFKDGLMGLWTTEGKEITPCNYEYVKEAGPGHYEIQLDGRRGVINAELEIIVPLIYKDIWYYDGDFGIVKMDDKWEFIDGNGKTIVSPRYDNIKSVHGGEIVVEVDKEYGVVNQVGEILLPIIYDEEINIERLHEWGFTPVTIDNRSGVIDSTYYPILPIVYNYFNEWNLEDEMIEFNFILVRKKKHIGAIHRSGTIIPCKYTDQDRSYNAPRDVLILFQGDEVGVINKDGKIVIPFSDVPLNYGQSSTQDSIGESIEEGQLFYREFDGICHIYTISGKILTKIASENLEYKLAGGLVFYRNEGKAYHLSSEGKWTLIPGVLKTEN